MKKRISLIKTTAKFAFIFILFLGMAFEISAQNVLWETYSEKGKQASSQGNYIEAEKLFKAALKEAENLKSDELIAESNSYLGALYSFQKKYLEAEKSFLKAIEIREQIGDKDSIEITYPLSNLGLIYAEQKKYIKAEELLRRALKIRENIQHPDTAVALLNLGKVYAEQKKLTEAQAVYEKAFETFLLAEDKNIGGILNTLHNLSLIFEELKNYKKLEPTYRIIIDLIGNNFGKNDESLIPYLEKYAVLLRKIKKVKEAINIETRAKKLSLLYKN